MIQSAPGSHDAARRVSELARILLHKLRNVLPLDAYVFV
jgi:hypothetical protein